MDDQLEHVRTRVVPGDVQHPLGAAQLGGIDLRVQDAFLVMQGTSDDLAVGVHDGAVAAVDPLAEALIERLHGFGFLCHICLSKRHAAADDERASLFSDVPQCGEPRLTPVPSRRHIDLRTPCVHRVARQGHVVLPADQPAQLPERCIVHLQRAAIALRPHQAFAARGHKLAVLAQDTPLGVYIEQRVVEAAPTRLSVALGHAHDHVRLGALRSLAQPLRGGAGDLDGVVQQPSVQLVEQTYLARRNRPHPIGISGDERLGEHDEASAVTPRLRDQSAGLVDGGVPIQIHGRRLHCSDLEAVSGGRHLSLLLVYQLQRFGVDTLRALLTKMARYLHGAELRAAHGAELGVLEHVVAQRLVVHPAGGIGIQG